MPPLSSVCLKAQGKNRVWVSDHWVQEIGLESQNNALKVPSYNLFIHPSSKYLIYLGSQEAGVNPTLHSPPPPRHITSHFLTSDMYRGRGVQNKHSANTRRDNAPISKPTAYTCLSIGRKPEHSKEDTRRTSGLHTQKWPSEINKNKKC